MQDFDVKKSKMLAIFVFFAPNKQPKAAHPLPLIVIVSRTRRLLFAHMCEDYTKSSWNFSICTLKCGMSFVMVAHNISLLIWI